MKILHNNVELLVKDKSKQDRIIKIIFESEVKVKRTYTHKKYKSVHKYAPWTQAEIDEIVKLRNDGWKMRQIAKKIGRTIATTYNRFYVSRNLANETYATKQK